jgi:general secretion pathway protein G
MDGSNKSSRKARSKGFSVAELITVVAIVAILASVAMPIANFGIRRQKEIELHERLRRITEAIDRYHELRLQPPGSPGTMKEPVNMEQGPWPKDLEELSKPIALNSGQSLRLLRPRDLIDPMTGRAEWITLAVNDDADSSGSTGPNVYEIHSKSTALALDGKTHYNEW